MPNPSKASSVTDIAARAGTPGFWTRARQGLTYLFRGEEPREWFGPLRPLPSIVPPGQEQSVEGRAWDYQVGENLKFIPRTDQRVTFQMMRNLSEWDVLAIIIGRRKDQLASMEWSIEPRDKTQRKALANKCQDAEEWWRKPDQRHTFREWLMTVMDDLLVIDAPCIFVNRSRKNEIWGFEIVDGSTIKPLIDARGRRPVPPDFAFSQALHGTPAMLYTTDDMIYKPRILRTHSLYGYSPIEQIIITVNTAIRRAAQQLDHFTEGSIPLTVGTLPKDWSSKQIEEFTSRWNARLAGNLAERERMTWAPDGAAFHSFPKVDLKDEFDEWLARVACAAYGLDPTPFVKQVNRGTQETTREAALAEGLAPYKNWVSDLIDECLERQGLPDLRFNWKDDEAISPDEKAKIDCEYVNAGVLHPNEIREGQGLDDLDDDTIAWLRAMARAQQVVPPPENWEDGQPPAPQMPELPEGAQPAAPPGAPAATKKPDAAAKGAAAVLGKAIAPVNRDRRIVKEAEERIARGLTKVFRKMAPDVAAQLSKLIPERQKAAGDLPGKDILTALDLAALDASVVVVKKNLSDVTQDALLQAWRQIDFHADDSIVELANEDAVAWAKDRAAEMVGKKWVDGDLVDNPNAEYVITEGTREHLRSLVSQAMDEGWSNQTMAANVKASYAFSETRAMVIARTETARADVSGNIIGWKSSGVVESKEWVVGAECCDECQGIDGVVVGLDEPFPNGGGDGPPLHPQCRCDVLPVLKEAEETGDEP